jgi:hypothetical protein
MLLNVRFQGHSKYSKIGIFWFENIPIGNPAYVIPMIYISSNIIIYNIIQLNLKVAVKGSIGNFSCITINN